MPYSLLMNGTGDFLWQSDGSIAVPTRINLGGATLVDTIAPAISGGLLYFVASDADGAELWAYDGANANKVSNINPGAASSTPHNLTDVEGILYFAATRADVGTELFSSDGTIGGTVLVENIVNSTNSSFPSFITNVGGKVYFYVTNINTLFPQNGYLYFHDPSTDITDVYFDFQPADAGSCVQNVGGASPGTYGEIIAMPGDEFYFIADGLDCRGKELWWADVCPPVTIDYDQASGNIVCNTNTSVAPVITEDGSAVAPADVCPGGNCFTLESSNPVGANLTLDPTTGVINAVGSDLGNYVIRYNRTSGGCVTTNVVSITVQEAVTADIIVEPISLDTTDIGNAGFFNSTLLRSKYDFGLLTGNPFVDGSVNIAFSGDSILYVADQRNHCIRKLDLVNNAVTTLAGSPGNIGLTDGIGASARFNNPTGIAVDAFGVIYVADRDNHLIRRIDPVTGAVTTVAGSTDGNLDNTNPLQARFNRPNDIAIDQDGNLYVADRNNHKIRKILTNGVVTTLAGDTVITPPIPGYVDSSDPNAVRFIYPTGLDIDNAGNVYVADQGNHRVRLIAPSGATSTLAGSGTPGAINRIEMGILQDEDGGALTNAKFFFPTDVSVTPAGAVYVADMGNHKIRIIESGQVTTYAGVFTGGGYQDNTTAANAQFNAPSGVASDFNGQVYILDRQNHAIRRTRVNNPAGTISGGGTFCAYDDPTVNLTLTDFTGNVLRWERITQSTNDTTILNVASANLSDTGFPIANETYFYRAIVDIGSCGQLPSETVAVDLSAPDLPTIVKNDPVCLTTSPINDTLVVSGAFDGDYRWYVGASGTTELPTRNDTLIVSISDTTTYSVSIVRGTCETSRVIVQAIVIPLPTPVITTIAPTCVGDVVTYNTPNNTGATYSWSINGLGSFVGDSTSNSVQVQWNTVGVGTIQVTETINGCEGVSTLENINVQEIPAPVINGSGMACAGDTTAYSVTTVVAGRSYIWTAVGGTIVGSNTASNINVNWGVSGMGQLILRETIDLTGCFFADTMNVTINPLPTPVANGETEVCEGDTDTYTVTSPVGGNTYAWVAINGTINGATNGTNVSVTWGTGGSGQLILQETIPVTSCVSYDTVNVNINPNPDPTITGNSTICNTDTIVYRITNTGNTYAWGVSNGVIVGNSGLDSVVVAWTGSTSGQVFVTETNPVSTCFGQDTLDVLINAIPAPTITGTTDVCFDQTFTYQIAASDVVNNSYTWTVTNGTVISGGAVKDDNVEVRWDGVNPGLVHVVETIDITSCFAENSLTININPLPTPTITGQDTLCPQDIESYNVVATGNNFNWIVTGGTITSGTGTNNITVQWGNAGNGQLIIEESTPGLGCIGRDTLDILINPLPSPSITSASGSTTICQGLTDTYSVMMNADRTYLWTVTGGTITAGVGTNSIDVQWGTAGAGEVLIRETITSTGCFLEDTMAVIIQPEPTPFITGDNEVCIQDTHTYSVTNSGNSFDWDVTNGTIIGTDTLSSVQIQWTGPDPGQIIITETITSTGCINRDTLDVTINPLPSPVITGLNDVCENQMETYSIPNTGNAFNWTVTNGTIIGDPTSASIQVIWNSTGRVIVRETITTTGCFLEDSLDVNVNLLPVNSINGQDTICVGDTENYSIVAATGNTYNWSIDNGNGTITGVNTADNVDINWTTAGTAQIILQETVTLTGCVNSDTLSVVIIDQPNTDITGPNSLCAGDTAFYQASTPPAGFTYIYTWTVQGGSILSGDGTSQVQVDWNNVPTGADYIIVNIQVQGSNCSATTPLPGGPGDMGFVVLNSLPTPVINSTTGMGDVCQVSTHQYSTTNDPSNTYNWTVTGGNIIAGAGTSDITVEWQTVGPGTLNLTQIVDSTGCTQSAAEVTVNIIESPGAPMTEDRNLCADGTANLFASEPTATQFNWYDMATGGTPLATTPSGTPFTTNTLTTAGSPYTFYVSALNATNCEGPRSAIQVTVDPTVNVLVSEVSLTNVETCNNDTSGILEVEFINGDSPYTYDVLLDGAPFITAGNLPFGSDTLMLRSLGVGTYTVNVTDDGGCTGTGTFTIISDPKFISEEFITSDTLIAEGESVTLRAGALDAEMFEWTDSLGVVLGTDSTLTITPPQSATYNVLITNDKGCDTTLSVRVDVVPLEIFVPNVFSPNGDNNNDRFQVFGTGIQSVKLRIFNRLGDLLFETDQWIEGTSFDDTIGWDGTFNSKIQQNGNYVWSLNGLFINNQPFKRTGNILLMR